MEMCLLGQDYYLAPFYDNPELTGEPNNVYDPLGDGDYPWFRLDRKQSIVNLIEGFTLFGDRTNWWVFNDKGKYSPGLWW